MSRFSLALTVVTSLVACGDDDSGNGGPYVGVDEIAAAYKQASCTYLVRCGAFPDQASCVDAAIGDGFFVDANVIAAIHEGTISYNGNALAACFEAVAMRECDRTSISYRSVPLVCSTYAHGTLPAGAECVLDQECISQQCAKESSELTCTHGTCIGDTAPTTSRLSIGSTCSGLDQCVTTAYCSTETSMCTKLAVAGAACSNSDECDYGLACLGQTGARTCRAAPTEGQPCPDNACRDEGLYCDAAGTCTRWSLPPAACSSTLACSPYYPCDFNTGTCKRGPGLGEPCSSANRCFSAGTFCDTTTFTCVETKPDGAPCTSDVQCDSANCDFVAGSCASRPTCF